MDLSVLSLCMPFCYRIDVQLLGKCNSALQSSSGEVAVNGLLVDCYKQRPLLVTFYSSCEIDADRNCIKFPNRLTCCGIDGLFIK